MVEAPDGGWVDSDDYDALAADNQRLRDALVGISIVAKNAPQSHNMVSIYGRCDAALAGGKGVDHAEG